MATKRRLAVLGAGAGSIFALLELTSKADWHEKFEITVYQMGWRIGGKGASGRNRDPKFGKRIEEHGLHIWAGHYQNSFSLMRDCYETARALGIAGIFDGVFTGQRPAFAPYDNIFVGERLESTNKVDWTFQRFNPDPRDGEPGDTVTPEPDAWEMLQAAYETVAKFLDGNSALFTLGANFQPGPLPSELGTHVFGLGMQALLAQLWEVKGNSLRPKHLNVSLALEKLTRDEKATQNVGKQGIRRVNDWILSQLQAWLHSFNIGALKGDNKKAWLITDIAVATIRGVLKDEVVERGFNALDDEEFTAWLLRHGAHPASTCSYTIQWVYDYCFAYRHGRATEAARTIAAGACLRGVARMFFGRKGHFFYKMNAGMGDTIFAPAYLLLKKRGVVFKFFHRVKELNLSADKKRIEQIRIERQVNVLQQPSAFGISDEYNPLEMVNGLWTWPSEPDFARISNGNDLKTSGINLESCWAKPWAHASGVTLVRGQDFDDVLLGIPYGALKSVAAELFEARTDWKRLAEKSATAVTVACQLWFTKSLKQLGWNKPGAHPIVSTFAPDFSTWADMSHLLPEEDWSNLPPGVAAPKAIIYLTGTRHIDATQSPSIGWNDYPKLLLAEAGTAAKAWLDAHAVHIWPDAIKNGAFDWDLLFDPDNGVGEARLASQYLRINVEPTDQYVMSPPGSTMLRPRADRSGFENLWLAGDWTRNGINGGSIEAAAMSGRRAARGLLNEDFAIPGETDGELGPAAQASSLDPTPVLSAPHSDWPWSAFYGQADTDGWCAVMHMPLNKVSSWLPEGLVPVQQDLSPTGSHPVFLLFNRQSQVRPNIVPFGPNYNELIFGIPFVGHSDASLLDVQPLMYMPVLYLDNPIAIGMGLFGWGFNKKAAKIVRGTDKYEVKYDKGNETLITCSILAGASAPAEQSGSAFPVLQRIFDMATVNKNKLNQWQYCYYDMNVATARVRPLELKIDIATGFQSGWQAESVNVAPLQVNQPGGFSIVSATTLGNPLQSFALRDLIRQRHKRQLQGAQQ